MSKKKGRWVIDEDNILICGRCGSVAGQRLHYSDERGWEILFIESPYCPFCGAKMDGERNEQHKADS